MYSGIELHRVCPPGNLLSIDVFSPTAIITPYSNKSIDQPEFEAMYALLVGSSPVTHCFIKGKRCISAKISE